MSNIDLQKEYEWQQSESGQRYMSFIEEMAKKFSKITGKRFDSGKVFMLIDNDRGGQPVYRKQIESED